MFRAAFVSHQICFLYIIYKRCSLCVKPNQERSHGIFIQVIKNSGDIESFKEE